MTPPAPLVVPVGTLIPIDTFPPPILDPILWNSPINFSGGGVAISGAGVELSGGNLGISPINSFGQGNATFVGSGSVTTFVGITPVTTPIIGSGTLTLSGTNTFTGGSVLLAGGTITDSGSAGSIIASNPVWSSGGSITGFPDRGNTTLYGGFLQISTGGSITTSGSIGSVTITNVSANTTLSGGSLQIITGGPIGDPSAGGSITSAGNLTLSNTSIFTATGPINLGNTTFGSGTFVIGNSPVIFDRTIVMSGFDGTPLNYPLHFFPTAFTVNVVNAITITNVQNIATTDTTFSFTVTNNALQITVGTTTDSPDSSLVIPAGTYTLSQSNGIITFTADAPAPTT